MATPTLASPEDLAELLGVAATNVRLKRALTSASNRFRDAVRHQVHHVENDQLTLDGHGERALRLPVAYVTAVHSVEVDGTPVQVRYSQSGLLERRDGRPWPKQLGSVTVTLDHGFREIPEGIRDAVLDAAEAAYRTRRGISNQQTGALSVNYDYGVTEQWVDAVERYQIGRGDRA